MQISGLQRRRGLASLVCLGLFLAAGCTPGQERPRKNHLAGETSPYLLEHATNPVDWYPWGKQALEKARREDKPIFLSVGYSTCHWCHVMMRECFEDKGIAALLNAHFVSIEVDREERPAIDEQYMLATQLLTSGHAGWPNSVWLLPDGRPFFAGTYFPRDRFAAILKRIANLWAKDRSEIQTSASQLEAAMRRYNDRPAPKAPLDRTLIDRRLRELRASFDSAHGGFSSAPKFPPHGALSLLAAEIDRAGDQSLLKMFRKTLDAMDAGGIHDHVGGGFHRYTLDAEWRTPHFEKMLCDNAQLLRAYADGYRFTKDARYAAVAGDIAAWIEREMTSPGGAFYTAEDSESGGKEGAFYLWSRKEMEKVLGKADGALVAEYYGIGDSGAAGVLYGTVSPEKFATAHKLDPAAWKSSMASARAALLAARAERPRPAVDTKIVASMNGLAIDGLAYAGRVLDRPGLLDAARRAATFIEQNLFDKKGRLLHTWCAGRARLPATLDDYADLAAGLLELWRATGDAKWRDAARSLAERIVTDFRDDVGKGFFYTAGERTDLLFRPRVLGGGGNAPSGNGVAVQVLLALDDPRYARVAEEALHSLAAVGDDSLLVALDTWLEERKKR